MVEDERDIKNKENKIKGNYSNGKQWSIFFLILFISILLILFGKIVGIILAPFLIIYDLSGIRIIYSYERGVVFTLGYYSGILNGGLIWIAPGFQKLFIVDIRINNIDLQNLSLITKDNVTITLNGTVFYQVEDPSAVVLRLQNYKVQLFNYSQTIFRDIVGRFELNDILQKREEVSKEIANIIQKEIIDWGIKIISVKIQDISIPKEIENAIIQQAQAARQKQAMILISEGEKLAAQNYVEAAKILQSQDLAFNLRVLQALRDMSADKIIVLPTDIFKWFSK